MLLLVVSVASSNTISPVLLTLISADLTIGSYPLKISLLFRVKFLRGICPLLIILFVDSRAITVGIVKSSSSNSWSPSPKSILVSPPWLSNKIIPSPYSNLIPKFMTLFRPLLPQKEFSVLSSKTILSLFSSSSKSTFDVVS